MNLNDKIAVVTGGASGIGRATAEALAEGGATVCIGDIARENGEAAAAEIRTKGRKAEYIRLDLTDDDSIKTFVAAVLQRFGRVDILVNGAGWGKTVPFLESDDPFWDRVIGLNFVGPMRLTKALLPQMFERKSGRIVNIASVAGLMPGGSSIAYASSKAALVHLTRCLAVALAPAITVNCIAPGLVENTRMALRVPSAVVQAARERAALRRGSSAEDIAEQCVGFCRADSVTGQTLVIDAGLHFH